MNRSPALPPLLPVIDVMQGRVVWGKAGQRETYRPIESPLVDGSDSLAVALALRQVVGHRWLYVADLDAIQGGEPQWDTLQQLTANDCLLLLDAGVADVSRANQLVDAGVSRVVVALETLPNMDVLAEIVAAIGSAQTVFSLDLQDGQPLADESTWGHDPLAIGRRAIDAGVGGMIVLDLAGVGVGQGVPTVDLCRQLASTSSDLTLITGGGVRHMQDVDDLLATGVDSVLVASALHRRTIAAR